MASESSALAKGANQELGHSGTYMPAGQITNEDYNRRLTGLSAIKQYEIMRRSSATVHSALQVVKLPLLSAMWDIDPAKNPDGEVEDLDDQIAATVRHHVFEVLKFKRWLKSALTYYDFGFSVSEKVWDAYEYDGKPYLGFELKPRKQTSIISWEAEKGVPGITQMVGGTFYHVPMEQLVVLSYDREGNNYEGISLLRYIFKDWDMLDKLTLVNAMALEKLGIGVPMVSARDESVQMNSKDELEAIAALEMWRAHNKAYLKVPASMKVEFMNLQGHTTKDILPTLAYHDGRIMTGVLARFMEIGGASGTGSQSLAGTLETFFMRAQEGQASEIVETFNELIKEIVDENYPGQSKNGYPKLKVSNISDDDLTALATNIASLMNAGAVTPDADIEDNLRQRFNLPAMSEEMRDNYGKDAIALQEESDNPDQLEKDKVTKKAIDEMKKSDKKNLDASIATIRAFRQELIGV